MILPLTAGVGQLPVCTLFCSKTKTKTALAGIKQPFSNRSIDLGLGLGLGLGDAFIKFSTCRA